MAKIFLSWGKPDEAAALPLAKRLKLLCLDVFEYSADMPTGAEIPDEVVDRIHLATVAIICFSDQTAHREWIERESVLAHQALRDGTKPMCKLLPVWVGPHVDNHRPAIVEEKNYAVLDLSAQSEAGLERLVDDVYAALGDQAPLIVPAAMVAMSHQEARDLFASGATLQPARDLCRALGMQVDDDLTAWLDRYAPAARDFAPFDTAAPLRETLEAAVGATNRARESNGARPLFLRWIDSELAGGNREERRSARDLFKSRPSLLVVDSLSVFSDAARKRLEKIPHPDDKGTSAVLWIPPFTGHTALADSLLCAAAEADDHLGDVFREWQHDQRPAVFDSLTPTTLRVAVERIFVSVPSELPPNPRAVTAGRSHASSHMKLSAILDPP